MKLYYFIAFIFNILVVLGCSSDDPLDNKVLKNHKVFFYEQRLHFVISTVVAMVLTNTTVLLRYQVVRTLPSRFML